MSPVPLDPPVPPAGSPVDEEEPVVAVEVEGTPAPLVLAPGPVLVPVPVNDEVEVEVGTSLPPAPPVPPASGSSPLQAPSTKAVMHESNPNVRCEILPNDTVDGPA
ncbi:hypothetical protein [Sorangium sp. So ce124]|uniref:hypothetical protein n=1 Tax=Sorangium sp. So ce124 TaxID=3133280 RepID=UPI003F61EE1B